MSERPNNDQAIVARLAQFSVGCFKADIQSQISLQHGRQTAKPTSSQQLALSNTL